MNFNHLTWPKQMIEDLKTFDEIGDIIIFDNCSDYEPLLEWYSTRPCDIVYSDFNRGHCGPWDYGLISKINSEYYVVTDPDLGLSETPKDSLSVLKEKLETNIDFDRIGLSIVDFIDPIPNVPHFHWLNHIRHEFWDETKKENGLLKGHIIDTTFAMYHISRHKSGPSCATDYPYSVRHLPWSITEEQFNNLEKFNYEFFNYLKTANSSSSYKSFTNFQKKFQEK
jgi:hypothetical protein